MSLATVLRLKDYHPLCRTTGCGGKANTLVSIEPAKPPRVTFYCDLCKVATYALRSEAARPLPNLTQTEEEERQAFLEAIREGRSAL